MTPPDDENDRRPAWGLRDDAFDDYLRSLDPPRSKTPPGKSPDAPEDDVFSGAVDEGHDTPRRRGRAKLATHPEGWFKNTRMSQTEVGLRLAKHLTTSPLVVNDVMLTLAGYELNKRDAPKFPVVRMLTQWGFIHRPGNYTPDDWRGFYDKPHQSRSILANFDRLDGHVLARLASGQRLVVVVSAGTLVKSKNATESNLLSRAIGRAARWKRGTPNDLLAVCLPRSERFRELVAEAREAEGVKRIGLIFLLVDRGGGFSGLPDTVS